MSEPGPSWPTVRTGSPIPSIGRRVTRGVEDKLSDALHERLTERFVDRRTSVLMRRLRENTMLETEISKTGEVVVEGHVIGRLDGFTFAADASAGGSEAKALQAAAQKALAGEIDARATRLSQAPDEQFVLASDGAMRWIGARGRQADRRRRRAAAAPAHHRRRAAHRRVARGGAGAARSVARRPISSGCSAPLFALAAAEDVTGIARGVAFQLIEAIGVLERQKVAEEVKGLDQPSRATLRKYGVRFGAYHLYLPALLKPAPRSLAAQLWALKHGSPDDKGLDELQRLAVERPHLDPGRQGHAEAALPHHRLSGLRRARDARRYPGAARRPDPSGAGLARRLDRHEAGRRVRRLRLHRHRRDDVADRRVGRGLRLDPALARLSHGQAAETGGAGSAEDSGGAGSDVSGTGRRGGNAGGCRAGAWRHDDAGTGGARADAERRDAEPVEDIAAAEPPAETAAAEAAAAGDRRRCCCRCASLPTMPPTPPAEAAAASRRGCLPLKPSRSPSPR